MYFKVFKICVFMIGVFYPAQALWAIEADDWNLANRVKERIAPYYGNTLVLVPQIVSGDKEGEPAFSVRGSIYLHPRLFGHLREKFPTERAFEAALAFIISHELAHHYNHSSDLNSSKNIDVARKRSLEEEADEEGFFKASLAGYGVSPGMMIGLFDLLYTKFPGLDREAYAGAEARVNATQGKISMIYDKHLPSIFQAASFLYAQNQPIYASACINYIYKQGYINEGICNDLGVIYLSAFLGESSSAYAQALFKYPLSFDVQTVRGRSPQVPPFNSPEALLIEAERYLGYALHRNPAYADALVNMAVLDHLKGALAQAQGRLDKIKAFGLVLSPAAQCMQGILYGLQNQPDAALKCFREAARSGSRVAEFNEMVLQEAIRQKGASPDKGLSPDEIKDIHDKIEDTLVFQTPYKSLNPQSELESIEKQGIQWPKSEGTTTVLIQEEKIFLSVEFAIDHEFNAPYQKMTLVYYDFDRENTFEINLLQVRPSFEGSTGLGIRMGSSYEELLQQYGRPDPEMNPNSLGDALYKYNDTQIVFEVKAKKVVGWTWFWE